MRDIALNATEDFPLFTTRVDTGAPTDVAGIVVSAYPDNSATQITAGITVSAPDSIAGYANVRVVATIANGYLPNTHYTLVITTGTVNSVSVVGAIVGEFTIRKNVPGLLHTGLAQATLSDATHIQLAAAANFPDDYLIGAIAVVIAGTGAGQSRVITDWDQSDDLATVDTMVAVDGTSVIEVYAGAPGSTVAPIPASLGTGAISAATFAAGAIDAAAIAADAIGSSEFSNAAAAKVFTQAMTEAYAADGAAATPAQVLYFLLAALSEFSVSGTTVTLKKLDGSTAAATLTLSDATNPTSITRAT